MNHADLTALEAPGRIIVSSCGYITSPASANTAIGTYTEYVRADIHEAAIAELRRKLDEARANEDDGLAWESLKVCQDKLRGAEALVSGLREDSDRLDWLEEANLRANNRNGSLYGWKYDINHNRASLTDSNIPALTIREAIDAARFPNRATEICIASAKEGGRLAVFDKKFPGVRKAARRFVEGK